MCAVCGAPWRPLGCQCDVSAGKKKKKGLRGCTRAHQHTRAHAGQNTALCRSSKGLCADCLARLHNSPAALWERERRLYVEGGVGGGAEGLGRLFDQFDGLRLTDSNQVIGVGFVVYFFEACLLCFQEEVCRMETHQARLRRAARSCRTQRRALQLFFSGMSDATAGGGRWGGCEEKKK